MANRRLRSNKRATDESFFLKNVGEIPVKYGRSTLMTIDEARGAAQECGVVL